MDLVDKKQSKIIQEEQKRDVALYFVEDGEEGFDPKRNQMIIDKTIKESEELRKKRHKIYQDQIGERADAVATYLKSRAAEGNTPLEKYFGKKYLSYLAGRKIMGKIENMKAAQEQKIRGVIPVKRKVYLTGD